MTTLHETPDGMIAYTKGAPEVILASCTRLAGESGTQPLGETERAAVLDAAQSMASDALRVLAVAAKPGATAQSAESEMTFLGLVGMIDPPRPEAAEAVQTCRHAGIKPVMITGDHPLTAQAVARELGLMTGGRAVTGAELDRMSPDDLKRDLQKIDVFARVSPAHKLQIVSALQESGHLVAMTGDGVNDAPALKKADIGVAMGITGTDVSKEAAAMTLTDDNFASIVAAVEEGRGVYGNIKKYLMYLLSSNVGEMFLMAGATLAGHAAPPQRRPDPVRQPRHGRPARAGAGGGPARVRPDGAPPARPEDRHLHPPRGHPHHGGRPLVHHRQSGPVRLGA